MKKTTEMKITVATAAEKSCCPICSAVLEVFDEKQVGDVIVRYGRCPICGSVFVENPDEARAVFETENDGADRRNLPELNDWRIKVMQLFKKNIQTVLDFGCGNGELVMRWRNHNVNAIGIDRTTPIQLKDIPNDTIDVVSMVEVVEHLADPLAVMKDLVRVLVCNGVIYIESSFVDMTEDVRTWAYNDVRIGHITLLSYDAVRRMFAQCGLEVYQVNRNVFIGVKRL